MVDRSERLERAKHGLEHRLDELVESPAGRPQPEVLDALGLAVRAAGVTPRRADLSAPARRSPTSSRTAPGQPPTRPSRGPKGEA